MRTYRFVLYGNDGAVRHVSVECLDDKHAMTIARVFASDHRVDVFCDMRRVTVLGDLPTRFGASANPPPGERRNAPRPGWAAIWSGIVNAFRRSG